MTDITEVEHDLMDSIAEESKVDNIQSLGEMVDMAIKRKNENLEVLETTELGRKKEKKTQFTEVKDSGKRQEFATGAVRDTQTGKGFPHLLPSHALIRLAQHFENGAKKYGKDNWRKGIPLSRYLDATFRHWCAIRDGLQDEDHCAACMWNVACFIETAYMIQQGKLPKELDDIGWLQEKKIDT